MLEILINLFIIGGIFTQVIGIMTVFSWALPIKPPADTSNRINRVRIWWYGVSAPHRMKFPWMSGDEADNLKDNIWKE